MINILVSVRPDLASSIALRYAGELGKLMEIGLQPIHIKEPEDRGNLFGTGWVRHTWEQALAQRGEEEIGLLIRTEKPNCPQLSAPRVIVGDKDEEILKEAQIGAYDLFMEGILASFNVAGFQRLLRSNLYQNMPCPIIVVKNLIPLEKTALLFSEGMDSRRLIQNFIKLFEDAKFPVDLLYYTSDRRDKLELQDGKDSMGDLIYASQLLENHHWPPRDLVTISGPPHLLADYLGDYALVGSAIKDDIDRKHPILTVFGRTPSPIFIC